MSGIRGASMPDLDAEAERWLQGCIAAKERYRAKMDTSDALRLRKVMKQIKLSRLEGEIKKLRDEIDELERMG
jgi:hypothetical protein